jgi:hypothetical protein
MIKANLGLANKGIGRILELSADAHIRRRGTANTVSPSRCPQSGVWMRLPFCILNVLGDVLDDGELYFVEAAQTLDAARARVQSLAEAWPGEYVIYDEATGERVLIHRTVARKNLPLEFVFAGFMHNRCTESRL